MQFYLKNNYVKKLYKYNDMTNSYNEKFMIRIHSSKKSIKYYCVENSFCVFNYHNFIKNYNLENCLNLNNYPNYKSNYHLNLIKSLVRNFFDIIQNEGIKEIIIQNCRNGNLSIIKWLSKKYPNIITEALANDTLVKDTIANDTLANDTLFANALSNNNNFIIYLINIAYKNGHLKIFKLLLSIHPSENKIIIQKSFGEEEIYETNYLHMLKWIYKNKFFDMKYFSFDTICISSPAVYNWVIKNLKPKINNNNINYNNINYNNINYNNINYNNNINMDYIFGHGKLKVLKYLFQHFPKITEKLSNKDYSYYFKIACIYERFNVAKWLLKKYPTINVYEYVDNIFDAYLDYDSCMSEDNSIKAMKWFIKNFPLAVDKISHKHEEYLESTYFNINYKTLKFLIKIFPKYNLNEIFYMERYTNICNDDKVKDLIKILKWLLKNKNLKLNDLIDITHQLNYFLISGRLLEFKWLIKESQIDNFTIQKNVFYETCNKGNLAVIKWIEKKYSESFNNFNSKTLINLFKDVCINNRIQIAKWLLKKYPHISNLVDKEFIFRSACKNGNLNMAKWLIQTFPNIRIKSIDNYAIKSAYKNNYMNIVNWIIKKWPEMSKIKLED